MATNGELEQRLANVEREVAELRQQLHGRASKVVDDLAGSMADVPEMEFQKFVHYGKESRDAQTEPTD